MKAFTRAMRQSGGRGAGVVTEWNYQCHWRSSLMDISPTTCPPTCGSKSGKRTLLQTSVRCHVLIAGSVVEFVFALVHVRWKYRCGSGTGNGIQRLQQLSVTSWNICLTHELKPCTRSPSICCKGQVISLIVQTTRDVVCMPSAADIITLSANMIGMLSCRFRMKPRPCFLDRKRQQGREMET